MEAGSLQFRALPRCTYIFRTPGSSLRVLVPSLLLPFLEQKQELTLYNFMGDSMASDAEDYYSDCDSLHGIENDEEGDCSFPSSSQVRVFHLLLDSKLETPCFFFFFLHPFGDDSSFSRVLVSLAFAFLCEI